MEIVPGPGFETQARLRLPKKVAKARRKNREAFAVHDPLFPNYEDGENGYLPAGDWWPSPITKEEL